MGDNRPKFMPVEGPENRAPGELILGSERRAFGRAPSNDVVLRDPEVSKFHAEIVMHDGGFVLTDLGSSNGTHVNGRPVHSHRLISGDVVEFGACKYEFEHRISGRRETTGVTLMPKGPVDSTQVLASAPIDRLVPGSDIDEVSVLRTTYERVRAAFEAVQSLIEITDIRLLCESILKVSFDLVKAETGAVLLFDGNHQLVPWATRSVADSVDKEIIISHTVVDQVISGKTAVLASDALTDSRWASSKSVVASGARSLMCVPLLNAHRIYGILHVGNATHVGAFLRTDLDLIGGVGTGAGVALSNAYLAHQLAQEARNREALGRFLSPAIVDQVVKDNVDIKRGGRAAQVTVLFADIRGFTALTERTAAADVVSLLNEYFDPMVEVVFKHQGILDKFMGDGLMAVWGTPVSREGDAEHAIAAACEMQEALVAFNLGRRQAGTQAIDIGIGLASGACIAGAVGASRRMEYTVIGDAVNLASRLCDRALAGEVICDEETYKRAGRPQTATAEQGVHLRGKDKAMTVYSLWAGDGE